MKQDRILIRDITLLGRKELYEILYDPACKQELKRLTAEKKIIIYTDQDVHFRELVTKRPRNRTRNEMVV